MMLCLVCCVLTSDILIHLKGCAKTVPLHTTLPANPRYWLGADSKTTPVGLCTTQSQVTARATKREPLMPLIFIPTCSWSCYLLLVFYYSSTLLILEAAHSLVYSWGHSPTVFLFHMDSRVGWLNGAIWPSDATSNTLKLLKKPFCPVISDHCWNIVNNWLHDHVNINVPLVSQGEITGLCIPIILHRYDFKIL